MNLLDLREPVSAWSHAAGMVLALPGTWLLWRRGAGERARQISLLVYGLSLAFCYGASMLYHGVRVDAGQLEAYQRLDHCGIYTLIAGSYTPIAWTLLRDRWRRWTLRLVWLAAAGGAALHLAHNQLPIWFCTILYMAMGWGSIFCYLEIARARSHRPLRPILVGGLIYSGGAILNVLQWPVLWPGAFGAHEVFHLFVLAGSLTHFTFMLRVVAPAEGATTSLATQHGPRSATSSGRPDQGEARRGPRAARLPLRSSSVLRR